MNETTGSGYQNQPIAVEPSATQRQAAKEVRGFFLALRAEGFTEEEAFRIIGYTLAGKEE